MTDALPILYSFRRCPYAMRARLAIAASGQRVALREILLRDKPDAFLRISPSATVPCLWHDGAAIDESFDIMLWALKRADPEGWLQMPDAGYDWIARIDGPFKTALDRVKYAVRHPEHDPQEQRAKAGAILSDLNHQIGDTGWIFDRPSLADYAILPFVRQFAATDADWLRAQPWPHLIDWWERFLSSDRLAAIMQKHTPWKVGDAPVVFPA